ncbi:MAG TPA: winged helix-turn-helix domain-containing protein [Pseudonocardiaceae bacterium]|jgi:DNA-binding transcriptional ArsR family regulator|nr:winged helix-turn-helix domain-containing protein [Pseudonocardiaceae bacterium]
MTAEDKPPPSTKRRPASRAEAAALASPVRLRIIRLTYQRALTNKEIARRLGKDPATTLYHVRKLVATGFLTAQPERVGPRGSKEIPYLSTGLSWHLSARDERDWEELSQAMLGAYLSEVADVGTGAVKQSRLALQLDEAGLAEFTERMTGLLEELAARKPTEGGQAFGLYVAWYPSG